MNTNYKRIAALKRGKEDELTRTRRALEIAVSTLESFSGIYENQQMSTAQVASTMLNHSIRTLVEIRKALEGE